MLGCEEEITLTKNREWHTFVLLVISTLLLGGRMSLKGVLSLTIITFAIFACGSDSQSDSEAGALGRGSVLGE